MLSEYSRYAIVTSTLIAVTTINLILGFILWRFVRRWLWNPFAVVVCYPLFYLFKIWVMLMTCRKDKKTTTQEQIEIDVPIHGPTRIVGYKTITESKQVTKERKVEKPKYKEVTTEKLEIVEIPKEETYQELESVQEPYQEMVYGTKTETFEDVPREVPIIKRDVIGSEKKMVTKNKTVWVSARKDIWLHTDQYWNLFILVGSIFLSLWWHFALIGLQISYLIRGIVPFFVPLLAIWAIVILFTGHVIRIFFAVRDREQPSFADDLACLCNVCDTTIDLVRNREQDHPASYYGSFTL